MKEFVLLSVEKNSSAIRGGDGIASLFTLLTIFVAKSFQFLPDF